MKNSGVISTDRAPGAIGPYSQGYIAGDFLFTSGQIAIDPATGEMPKGIETQTKRCCENIEAILKAAGLTYENVIKTTCFLADMEDFSVFNKIYAEYFISKPARSTVAVKSLPKGALCEIEAVAVK